MRRLVTSYDIIERAERRALRVWLVKSILLILFVALVVMAAAGTR